MPPPPPGAAGAAAVDELIFDRFGPPFSATQFRWHCDALPSDPQRRISVVAYFSDTVDYEGGVLQMKLHAQDRQRQQRQVERRYAPGWAVAFPSTKLEHRVTPVTQGERRSLLLIAGQRANDCDGSAIPPSGGACCCMRGGIKPYQKGS